MTDCLEEGGRSRTGRALSHSSVLELVFQASMAWWYIPKPKRWPAEMYPCNSSHSLACTSQESVVLGCAPQCKPTAVHSTHQATATPKGDLAQGTL